MSRDVHRSKGLDKKSRLSRRDFLKAAGVLSAGAAIQPALISLPGSGRKNVIVVVLDALSAGHLSLHGYARETAPNITKLAQQAVVYHRHYAPCNWTGPSTASLLTGTYPWTHRAVHMNEGVAGEFRNKNLFAVLPDHSAVAYTHNPMAAAVLERFPDVKGGLISPDALYLTSTSLPRGLFEADRAQAELGWGRIFHKTSNGGYAYSLLWSDVQRFLNARRAAGLEAEFPRGLPGHAGDNYFLLEDAIDYFSSDLRRRESPFLAYLHFFPPHSPYNSRAEFVDTFANDGLEFPGKPRGLFTTPAAYYHGWLPRNTKMTAPFLAEMRRQYDEYILYADSEFGRFWDSLDVSGLLKDTWVVLTSDHGELFERGMLGHSQPAFFEPEMRVPLLIFEPGRTERVDVEIPTSTVDVLATLLNVSGQPVAEWSEGVVLPPYANSEADASRSVFAASSLIRPAPERQAAGPRAGSLMHVQGRHKLIYHYGYRQLKTARERVELYDVVDDPEELQDLSESMQARAEELLEPLRPLREVFQSNPG